jgi:nucleoside-diphosphate-sugar epimerase
MVIVLGLGFTGQRLARRLLQEGIPVCAAVRGVERFRELADAGLTLFELLPGMPPALPKHAILAHLIPPVPTREMISMLIREIEPSRIVYVSSTGVYGDQVDVNEKTPPSPNDERGRLRLEEEHWIAAGPWTSLILRSAAIYGPGRGVHVALREGRVPRGGGSGIVSRIHVDDLAAIMHAGLFSAIEGAWPVADDDPCSTAEIAAYCSDRQIEKGPANNSEIVIPGRRVDGTMVREKLGIELTYPSWRSGIPASIAEEELVAKQPRPRVL